MPINADPVEVDVRITCRELADDRNVIFDLRIGKIAVADIVKSLRTSGSPTGIDGHDHEPELCEAGARRRVGCRYRFGEVSRRVELLWPAIEGVDQRILMVGLEVGGQIKNTI